MPKKRPGLKVWRYMSFGRFVWMLKRRALWMCRADQLDDAWEGVLGAQEHPAAQQLRRRIYVNSWTASNSESHAMWSIYCNSKEGVAIQATLSQLKASVADAKHLNVLPVRYVNSRPLDLPAIDPIELAVRKRRPFAYEKEHRIVYVANPPKNKRPNYPPGQLIVTDVLGFPQAWNPETWIDAVLMHPGADYTFQYALEAVVEALAPQLKDRIHRSRMAIRPRLS